jgi:hypothetical protein
MRWLVLSIALFGCGSSNDSCGDNEVEVDYFRGPEDGKKTCAPIPAACGATASCSVQACEGAMYGLCDTGYLGVGCSDTFPPTIISCNP